MKNNNHDYYQPYPYGPEIANVTPIQEQAITYLIMGYTISDVARTINVNRSTIYRWLRDSHFVALYNQRRAECWDHLRNAIFGLGSICLDGLRELLQHANPSVRLRTIMVFFKALGLLDRNARPADPCDPEGVEQLWAALGQHSFSTAERTSEIADQQRLVSQHDEAQTETKSDTMQQIAAPEQRSTGTTQTPEATQPSGQTADSSSNNAPGISAQAKQQRHKQGAKPKTRKQKPAATSSTRRERRREQKRKRTA
ncbi:MAG: helix-turn-helix domain-containing protein [Chloroflexaceae bacterium]|nr:helix-turn-helix domain-containing protein [Chloroflexaceae bacterium]